MAQVQLPEGYQTIMPYLILKNTAAFLTFMKNIFAAEEKMVEHNEDGSVRHGELIIGGSTIMFAECKEPWQPQNAGLFIYVPDADATYANALAAGAISLMGLTNQDYGRTCGIEDPFGNTWWVTSLL